MILVDTSVWVDHFRRTDKELIRLLNNGEVVAHSMVIGELACGSLPRRTSTLRLLEALPSPPTVPDQTVFHAIETHRWFSQGIGWIDAHLLTAVLLSHTLLWTRDQRLSRIASVANVAYHVR